MIGFLLGFHQITSQRNFTPYSQQLGSQWVWRSWGSHLPIYGLKFGFVSSYELSQLLMNIFVQDITSYREWNCLFIWSKLGYVYKRPADDSPKWLYNVKTQHKSFSCLTVSQILGVFSLYNVSWPDRCSFCLFLLVLILKSHCECDLH